MSQRRTSGDEGISEAGRLRALMVQFPPLERPWPMPRQLLTPDLGSDLVPTDAGPVEYRPVAPEPYTYAPEPAVERGLPVQTMVNRRDFLPPKTVDIEIVTQAGKVIQILRYPEFGPYGRDPMDAAWFPDYVNASTAICSVLAPYAAVRCLAGAAVW